jgi:hypothetical protein
MTYRIYQVLVTQGEQLSYVDCLRSQRRGDVGIQSES